MLALMIIIGAPIKPLSEESISVALDTYQITGLVGIVFIVWCAIVYLLTKKTSHRPGTHSIMEKLQWGALIFLIIDLYVLELKASLLQLEWLQQLTSITDILSILLYLLYLISLWYITARNMRQTDTAYSPSPFVMTRFKFILPAIIPYLIITIIGTILELLPVPSLKSFLSTTTASVILFIIFLGIAMFFIPWFMQYIWGCTPIEDPHIKHTISTIVQRFRIKFRDILLWPQPDDKHCTAAVIGILPQFRYLIITPCLLKYLSINELEAVIAHEVAHIRYRHMLWYIIFIIGYSLIIYNMAEPLINWVLSHKFMAETVVWMDYQHPKISSILILIPFMIFIIGYFRFFMGYFMRNFEREADSAVFEIHGAPWHLINALEKIGIIAGNIRNQPSWHHYSIAERTQFLQDAAFSPHILKQFKNRLKFHKMLLVISLALLSSSPQWMPIELWKENTKSNLMEIYLEQILHQKQERPEIYIMVSQIFFERGERENALKLLQKALQLDPNHPDALNNWAWIIATDNNAKQNDLETALDYAQKAAQLKPSAPILDTLAECYCRIGQRDNAKEAAHKALTLAKNTDDEVYYEKRLQEMDKCQQVSSTPPQ